MDAHREVRARPAAPDMHEGAKHELNAARSLQVAGDGRSGAARRALGRGADLARLTPRCNSRSSPPSNIAPAAHADMTDNWLPAPALSGQKPANNVMGRNLFPRARTSLKQDGIRCSKVPVAEYTHYVFAS
jgi:hypothetical protein